MNVYLQSMGMSALSEDTSRTINFKSTEYMKSKILPGRNREVNFFCISNYSRVQPNSI